MINLEQLAARLDDREELYLRYRLRLNIGGSEDWEIRTDRLLDVAEESGILYVSQDGQPVWVRVDEAIEVVSEP